MSEKALELKNKGNSSHTSKNYDDAVKYFTEAIEIEPSNQVLYSNRSASYSALGKYQEALEDAKKAISLKSDWSKGYLRETVALYNLGRFEEAEKAARKGLELEPNNAQLKESLEDAIEAIEGKADPMGAMANLFGPQNIAKLRTNPKTASYFLQPDFVKIIDELSRDPKQMNKYLQDKRVISCFGVLLGVDMSAAGGDNMSNPEPPSQPKKPEPVPEKPKEQPKKPEPVPMTEAQQQRDLGNKAYVKKDFETAITHYDKAIELDPTDILAMNNKGAVYLEQGKVDDAIAQCKSALEKANEIRASYTIKSKVFTRLGNCYLKADNIDEAYKNYQHALIEDKNNETTANMKKIEKLKKQRDEEAYLSPEISLQEKNKGIEHFKKGEFPEAIKAFEEAIRRNPKDHTIYSNRSACYSKLLEYPLAIKDADKCIELDPNFIKGYIRKGAALYAMRDYHKALEVYDQGLKIDHDNQELLDLSKKTVYALNKHQSELTDEERVQQAAKDPEVLEILQDPIMNQILKDMQENPKAAQDHLKNPLILKKFQKLVSAGVVKLG